MSTTPKRITLTVAQCRTPEGQALLNLCRSISEDGTIDITEARALRSQVGQSHGLSALPAAEFLREHLDDILEDGRLDAVEIGKLFKAVLRVLPKDAREVAQAVRQDVEQREAIQWREDAATERQLAFIRDLGGTPAPALSKGEASDLIESLLTGRDADAATPRQQMVLRFWNRLDLLPLGKDAIIDWMDNWYDEDGDRLLAWELWKDESGDTGERSPAHITRVKIGAGSEYLARIKAGGSQADTTPPSPRLEYKQGTPSALPRGDTTPASSAPVGVWIVLLAFIALAVAAAFFS